jgi:hypothetical protein
VDGLTDGFVGAGSSDGAGTAEYVATQRPRAGGLSSSGALPLDLLGHVS